MKNILNNILNTTLVHFLIIVLLLTFLLFNPFSLNINAQQTTINQSTTELENLNLQNPKNIQELKKASLNRKNLLVNEAVNDPIAFLADASLIDKKQNFPSEIQTDIEERIDTSGEFLEVHIEKVNRETKTEYLLKTSNKFYKIYFTKGNPNIKSGSTVNVKGISIDSILVTSSPGTSTPEIRIDTLNTPIVSAPTDEKTAVLLINFTNNTTQPVTPATINSTIFTDPGSVSNYYKENSFNQTNFNGQVFGWYTLSSTDDICENNYGTWSSEADSKATQAGVDLTTYKHIVYIFTTPVNCSFGGLGTIGGQPGRAWIFNYQTDRRMYAHELGHNLGIHHSNSLSCGTKAIDNYANCTESEYGDVFDVMGNFWFVDSNLFHFNALHKIAVGWIPASRVQTITNSGIYNVIYDENTSSSVQALKIAKPDTGENYYLSYRKPVGFDLGISPNFLGGTSIHVWNNDPTRQTKLIDTTPGSGNLSGFEDASLKDNQIFTDSTNQISVTQKSHTVSQATLSVNFLNKLSDLIVTNFTWSPSSPTPGNSVILSVTIKNQGSWPTPTNVIQGVGFYFDATTSANTWTDNYTQSIPAGSSVTLTANGPPWKASLGTHSVIAKVDDVNRIIETNETNNSLTKTISVQNPLPSPTPTITPTVTPKPTQTPTPSPTLTPTPTPTPTPINLVTNPGCNINTNGWWGYQSTLTRVTSVFRSGGASCQVAWNGTGTDYSIDDAPNTIISPTFNKKYTATAYVRSDTAIGKPVQLMLRQSGGTTPTGFSPSTAINLSTTWQKLTSTITVNASDRTSVDLYIFHATNVTSGNSFQVDDITLNELP